MGTYIDKLPPLVRARQVPGKYQITATDSEPYLVSNDARYHEKRLSELADEDLLYFVPVYSWQPAYRRR